MAVGSRNAASGLAKGRREGGGGRREGRQRGTRDKLTMRMRISFLPNMRDQILETESPMFVKVLEGKGG